MLCKGKTKGGERCGRNAGDSGYCSAHNPEKLAAKALRDEAQVTQFERMNDVLATIHRTGKAKGWIVQLASQDTATWRYATVTVESGISMSSPVVTGRMNLTVGGEIKISLDKTSFYDHGLRDLVESVWNELHALPWVEAPKKKVSPPGIDRVLKIAGRFHTELIVSGARLPARRSPV